MIASHLLASIVVHGDMMATEGQPAVVVVEKSKSGSAEKRVIAELMRRVAGVTACGAHGRCDAKAETQGHSEDCWSPSRQEHGQQTAVWEKEW